MKRTHGDGEVDGKPPASEASAQPLPLTAAAARAAVAALLHQFGFSPDRRVVTDALMITSELVTNAIRHGGGLSAFGADIHGGALRVLVADHNPVHPVARTAAAPGLRIGGYGWPLIQSLADLVTVTPHGSGKQITADLALL